MEKKPRLLGLAGLVVALALLAAGCARPAAPPTAAESPRPGGTLVIGWDQEPKILNALITGGDLFATAVVTGMVVRGFFRITPKLDFEPFLVERTPSLDNGDIKVEGGKMTMTWRIKKNAKWSDGKDVTSEDVKFTLDTIMNKKFNILTREGYELIEATDTSDPKVFKATFKQPYNQWILLFSGPMGVLPKHVLEGKDFNNEWLNSIPVANGPYLFKEWKKGESITLVRNENYWGPHKAYIDQVTFKYITDTAALKNAFRAGEVQFIQPPPDIAQVEEIQGYPGVKVKVAAGVVWEHLGFNVTKPGLDKKEVRQAIAYCIDRDSLVQQRLKGQVKPLQSFVVPELSKFQTPAWQKYKRDVNKAKELLAKAGYTPEKPLKLTISTTAGNKAREDNEAFFQQQLKECGIQLEIKNTEAKTFFGDWIPKGTFEIGEWAWLGSPGYAGAASLINLFTPDQIPTAANDYEGQNYYRYNNPQVGEINNKLKGTLDEEEGAKLIKQVQEIMAEDVPLLPLYQRIDPIAFSEKIRGPENNPTQEGPFWNIEDWWFGA